MYKICLIDYGSGNIQSVRNALEKISDDHQLNVSLIISHDPSDILIADKIILPGVGSFKDCIEGIKAHKGVLEALTEAVLVNQKPFLGICVGMQLMAQIGEEFGSHQGLGFLEAKVIPFEKTDLKIPHMGWNKIFIHADKHPILAGISSGDYVYFVHSYRMQILDQYIGASCDYGINFPALVIKNNMVGCQFHPEKSQKTGLKLLRNFIEWTN